MLAETVVTVTPSVTSTDWLYWWHKQVADLVPASSTLAFGKKMNDKCIYTSPSVILVKNHWKTISTEEKLDVISQPEKRERIVDICYNVRFSHISMCTVQ